MNNAPLASYNFGEYEGRREHARSETFFLNSFLEPISFSLQTISASKNFLIIGRKGSGKTASQLVLQNRLISKGYICGDIVFHRDISSSDYLEFAQSQSSLIDITTIRPNEDISILYDFRALWRRILLIKFSEIINNSGKKNRFTEFCRSTTKGTNSIVDGILKNLSVEISGSLGFLDGSLTIDTSKISSSRIKLDQFNSIATNLLIEECKSIKCFLFIDELVISSLNTFSDEYRLRLSLIRDLVKITAEFNDLFVTKKVDFHVIMSMRPEIRHRVNMLDAEISKTLDGNDVLLHWDFPDRSPHPLIQIMMDKIRGGAPENANLEWMKRFQSIEIGILGQNRKLDEYVLINSWFRPRDMVRYLKCFAKVSPNATEIDRSVIRNSMKEYARVSAKELFDELSVKLPQSIISTLNSRINKKRYKDVDEFLSNFVNLESHGADRIEFAQFLFEVGLIGNFSNGQFFSAHRQEEEIKPHLQIQIHPGLWRYFNITDDD